MKKSIKTIAMVLSIAAATCAIPAVAYAGPMDLTTPAVISTQVDAGTVIEEKDYDAFVNASDGLNVREAANTESRIMNKLGMNTKVHVTGKVTEDGVDTGWVRIDTVDSVTNEKCDGFVKAEFLSDTAVVVNKTVTKSKTDKNTATTTEDAQAMMQSDAIADVIDQAQASGLFTKEEIDDAISEITERQNQKCTTEEEKQAQADQISGVLNDMQQTMIDNGYTD